MIGILDYGMSNLRSVVKAFERLGAECQIVEHAEEIAQMNKLVVPGQGAFQDCMHLLNEKKLVPALQNFIRSQKPYLGICLGMQILMEGSDEAPGIAGLGIFKGWVRRFSAEMAQKIGLKIPHMGWNSLHMRFPSKILNDLDAESYVYFVHSYYVDPEDISIIAAQTHYGVDFAACLEYENIFATQFHPEKSQQVGLHILKNFCDL